MTKEINWSIKDALDKTFSFNNVDTLKEFAKNEAEFWQKQNEIVRSYKEDARHPSRLCYKDWQAIFDILEEWEPMFQSWDQETTNDKMRVQIQNWNRELNYNWVWSGHPFIHQWIESYKFSQATGDGFFEAFVRNNTQKSEQFDWLRGYILAYEFQLQDESTLTKRRHSEKNSFIKLRNQLAEKKDELIDEVKTFQIGFKDWSDNTQQNYSEWFQEKQSEFQHSKENNTEAIESERKSQIGKFEHQFNFWIEKINELEHTYKEKLKLEMPAQYWKVRSLSLRNQGFAWIGILFVVISSGGYYFTDLFKTWLKGEEMALSLHTFQGALLLTVIISSFIFLIRVTSRLAFSAFHLQRDAEEREQLAYVYLALVNEAKADDESRKIILQSLFSRAETGLLKGDSGPTMPITDAISAISKAGKN